jgi:hypothetical protein
MKIPDIKKVKPRRPLNPFSAEEQIFKCSICLRHKYLTEKLPIGNICKSCAKEEAVEPKANQVSKTPHSGTVETIGPASEVPTADVQTTGGDSADAGTTGCLEAGSKDEAGTGSNDG